MYVLDSKKQSISIFVYEDELEELPKTIENVIKELMPLENPTNSVHISIDIGYRKDTTKSNYPSDMNTPIRKSK